MMKIKPVLLVVAFVMVFVLGATSASAAWRNPIAAPPNGNTPPPLNVGGVGQEKLGGLVLGLGAMGFAQDATRITPQDRFGLKVFNGRILSAGSNNPNALNARGFCLSDNNLNNGYPDCITDWSELNPARGGSRTYITNTTTTTGGGGTGTLTGTGAPEQVALWDSATSLKGSYLWNNAGRLTVNSVTDNRGPYAGVTNQNILVDIFGKLGAKGLCLPTDPTASPTNANSGCITAWSDLTGFLNGVTRLNAGSGILFNGGKTPITTTGEISADSRAIVSVVGSCGDHQVMKGIKADGTANCVPEQTCQGVNCPAPVAGIDGSGTVSYLPVFTGPSTIANSMVRQIGSTAVPKDSLVDVAGNLWARSLKVDTSQDPIDRRFGVVSLVAGRESVGVLGSAYNSIDGIGVYGTADAQNTDAKKGSVGGYFRGTNGAGALNTRGPLKLLGIGEGDKKVLASDANGNASWKTLAEIGAATTSANGTGKAGRVTLWKTDKELNYSNIYESSGGVLVVGQDEMVGSSNGYKNTTINSAKVDVNTDAMNVSGKVKIGTVATYSARETTNGLGIADKKSSLVASIGSWFLQLFSGANNTPTDTEVKAAIITRLDLLQYSPNIEMPMPNRAGFTYNSVACFKNKAYRDGNINVSESTYGVMDTPTYAISCGPSAFDAVKGGVMYMYQADISSYLQHPLVSGTGGTITPPVYNQTGTAVSDTMLEVNGSVKIADGTQGNGKLYVSLVDGTGVWKTKEEAGLSGCTITGQTIRCGDDTITIPTSGGDTSIPAGAVMPFNLTSCPSGWAPLANSAGRAIVGAAVGGTVPGVKGTAIGDMQLLGQHYHHDRAFNNPPPSGTNSGQGDLTWALGPSGGPIGNGNWFYDGPAMYSSNGAYSSTGNESGSMPYTQLLMCQKVGGGTGGTTPPSGGDNSCDPIQQSGALTRAINLPRGLWNVSFTSGVGEVVLDGNTIYQIGGSGSDGWACRNTGYTTSGTGRLSCSKQSVSSGNHSIVVYGLYKDAGESLSSDNHGVDWSATRIQDSCNSVSPAATVNWETLKTFTSTLIDGEPFPYSGMPEYDPLKYEYRLLVREVTDSRAATVKTPAVCRSGEKFDSSHYNLTCSVTPPSMDGGRYPQVLAFSLGNTAVAPYNNFYKLTLGGAVQNTTASGVLVFRYELTIQRKPL